MIILEFGEPVFVPNISADSEQRNLQTLSEIINDKTLTIMIDSQTEPGQEPIEWTCLSFTENELHIQLKFENPLSISADFAQSLSVKFNQP